MQNIILTPIAVPELVDMIATEVEARIHRTEYSEPPQDRISLHEATQITRLQKSALYKMTMAGTIPHEKFGKRLVFSRRELADWIEQRTIRKHSPEEIIIQHLAKVAKRKMNKSFI